MSEIGLVLKEGKLRVRLNKLIETTLTKTGQFVPAYSASALVHWLLSLGLTREEMQIAHHIFKEQVLEYERRLRLLKQEIEQEYFNRFGGK